MSVLVNVVMLLSITGGLKLAIAEKWVKSNPQGNFAMGFLDGYINNGDYEVVVPKGSDETKRDVFIKGKNVRDSVDMIFNTNTMVFSNWDGYFKLGDQVYSDTNGVLYFMRSDHKCVKKKYDKQGDEIRAIEREILDGRRCQAIKANVDEKMNHFLKYPFKYMLPKADLELATKKGFPGGEYYAGKVSGNVYVCQFTVSIPSGDSDKKKEIEISAPGISDTVKMRIDSNTQIFGRWDGFFYIGDKVYTNEPRVLYVDNDKGGCVKKVFEDHDTSISIAFTKILKGDECFLIKNEVYNSMQHLIADPKLLSEDEKPKLNPQSSPPITVTSTISGSPLQSTHSVTLNPVPLDNNLSGSKNTDMDVSSPPPGSGQTRAAVNYQEPTVISGLQQPLNSAMAGVNSNVHISTITSDHPDYPSVTATSVVQNSNQQKQLLPSVIQPQYTVINQGQQPLTSSMSGMNSNVHISTVTSDHPDYPSITATSVVQSSNQQQQLLPSVSQPQNIVINPGQQPLTSSMSGMNSNVHISTVTSDHPDYPTVTATSVVQSNNQQQEAFLVNQGPLPKLLPQQFTVSQINNGVPSQQIILDPTGEVQLVVPTVSQINNGVSSQNIALDPTGEVQLVVPAISQLNNAVSSQNLVLGPTGEVRLFVPPASSSSQSADIFQPAIIPKSNPVLQTDQYNALNVHSNNVNIQSDGSLLVNGKSVIMQGIDPSTELVTPGGSAIRVGRSVTQGTQQMESSVAYQVNSPPVLTLTGSSKMPSGKVQTVLAVPPNQVSPEILHTTTVNIPRNEIPQGSMVQQTQSQYDRPVAVNTNFLIKSESTQKPATKLYLLKNEVIANNDDSGPKPIQNSPLLLKLIQPAISGPTVLTLQSKNTQLSTQDIQSPNIQNLNEKQSSQRTNIMLSTLSQGNTISMNHEKPMVLSVQQPSVPQQSQITSNVHLNVGSTESSILINSKENKLQTNTYDHPLNDDKKENDGSERDSSVYNIMRDLKLPSPVNNLIVNIAENTNFHKKKK